MNKERGTREYVLGVNEFLGFASKSVDRDGKIWCPNAKCVNFNRYSISTVHDHLIQYGMSTGYKQWFAHGELQDRAASSSTSISIQDSQMYETSTGMHGLLYEVFPLEQIGRAHV